MSPLLDPTRTEKSARTRIDTKTRGAFRGTDGSNPVPSSGESANFRSTSSTRFAGRGQYDGAIIDKRENISPLPIALSILFQNLDESARKTISRPSATAAVEGQELLHRLFVMRLG
jgi:hypothetical protein